MGRPVFGNVATCVARDASLPRCERVGRWTRDRHVRVAIVGAGFGGLGAAIRLLQSGERDIVVLEKADDIGGTWRDNTYPGCACDVPSVLYSFSFAPNPDWSRSFSGQQEIWDYLRACVDRFDLRPLPPARRRAGAGDLGRLRAALAAADQRR